MWNLSVRVSECRHTITNMLQPTNMKKVSFFLLAACWMLNASAQFVLDYRKAADSYFQKGDYASAAEYYEKFLSGGKTEKGKEFNPYAPNSSSKKTVKTIPDAGNAWYKLAECYRLLNYPSKAEPVYQRVMNEHGAEFPLARYHRATQLRALGKYAEAEKELKAFLAAYSTGDEYRKNAEREVSNLAFIQQQLGRKDLKYFTLSKAPGALNTTGASYAPVWLNAGTLLFTSTRPLDTLAKVKTYTNRIYEAAFSEGTLSGVTLSAVPQEKEIQQGVNALTPDGNTMFLTRWSVSGQQKKALLYSSTRTAAGWSEPKALGTSINAENASTQQPFVTADGKYLLFASDRAGGQGGFDIWYAPLTNGEPGTPVNMGRTVNTSYDEQAPAYHEASRSLIFSSNGRVGMGGYDFFMSKGQPGGAFTEAVNMGYPVNSIKDDMYFISRGSARNMLEDVMLSSDRDAACCLELFYLRKEKPLKQISGKIVSCDPIRPFTSARVSVVDTVNNKTILSKEVGADGSYSFTLEEHQPLKVQAEATGFLPNSLQAGTPADPEEIFMSYPDLCLTPEPPKPDDKFVLENVYYDFNKAELKEESYPTLDYLVDLMNKYPNMVIELGAHTDSKGRDSYNLTLSEARAQSVVKYLIEKGIAAERLVAKGYGETQPVADNTTADGKDNPEGRARNRRTEFKVLKNEP